MNSNKKRLKTIVMLAMLLTGIITAAHAEDNSPATKTIVSQGQQKITYSPVKKTTFFADGNKFTHKAKAGTVTVYVDLDAHVGGSADWLNHLHAGKGVKLVTKKNGSVVAVENGVELSARQIQFDYTGGPDFYWDEVSANDPTNSVVIQRH